MGLLPGGQEAPRGAPCVDRSGRRRRFVGRISNPSGKAGRIGNPSYEPGGPRAFEAGEGAILPLLLFLPGRCYPVVLLEKITTAAAQTRTPATPKSQNRFWLTTGLESLLLSEFISFGVRQFRHS